MENRTHGLFIVDSLGKLLVTHPTGHSLNKWSIPKGLAEDSETSIESAFRETYEETNLNLYDWMYGDANEEIPNYNKKYSYGFVLLAELGVIKYASKKKEIEAHVIILDTPASKLDLELWCESTFTIEGSDKEIPENDEVKWETIQFAEKYLHESQIKYLDKVKKLIKMFVKEDKL